LWREIARSNQKRGKRADEHGGNQRRMDEQEGQIRAGYGEEVVIKFSKDLRNALAVVSAPRKSRPCGNFT